MADQKTLLSIRDLKVQFHVRGRVLTAIRGVSLDIYENECIAIVGESGSGKSVFTKTFAGMLDANGFIPEGHIILNDDALAKTDVTKTDKVMKRIAQTTEILNRMSGKEFGAETYRAILELESEKRQKETMNPEEKAIHEKKLKALKDEKNTTFNTRQTLDSRKQRAEIKELTAKIRQLETQIKEMEAEEAAIAKSRTASVAADAAYQESFRTRMEALKSRYAKEITQEATPEMKARNEILAKELVLSLNRFPGRRKKKMIEQVIKATEQAMTMGIDFSDPVQRDKIYESVTVPVHYVDETPEVIHGYAVLDMANIKNPEDWTQIRGGRIATVFQDPMTSLNPLLTIGKQISSIIIKHQNCTEAEARIRALEMMEKVGIPNPAARFDDYPFQYSGGMRQRIVIAIALACQPKILICDEPTTALDVTIQAQILQLIKDLQKEFGFTTVFITHDLGVVANVADRVAVLYAGQIVELGTVEDVFYDPRHPYTWALLSSLPQLAERNTTLYSITGTPPSLYNEQKGDAFAPRNPYCLKVDTLKEPPMFAVSDTHYAKTWLLHPDAPKIEKPEGIRDIHSKLMKAFNI